MTPGTRGSEEQVLVLSHWRRGKLEGELHFHSHYFETQQGLSDQNKAFWFSEPQCPVLRPCPVVSICSGQATRVKATYQGPILTPPQ